MNFDFEQSHSATEAILYCRVSSKAQVKRGDGLGSQETRSRQYADYKNYSVLRIFTDDMTGKRADRPGIQALLAFLKQRHGTPTVVIVDDITRFARRVNVHFDLRAANALAGGILESPSVEFRDDADGELHEYILASVSQHQSKKNAEQVLNRMKARSYNGYWVFQAPIGYKYEKITGHGKMLVRNEPLASIVQEALEGFALGRFDTQVEVKRFLENQPAFPKDLSNGQIRNQRVADILNRLTYAGFVDVPNWDIRLRKGHHEGLITLEMYQKIQNRLKDGAKTPARKDISADFVLRGFVNCGDCAKPLTACWSTSKSGKKHPYYSCYNRACSSRRKSIPRQELESAFERIVAQLKPSEMLFKVAKTAFKSVWNQRLSQMDSIKREMQAEIIRVEKQIEQLVDRIIESESPTAISAYEKRISKLETEKLIAAEKLATGIGPKRSFDEMFEHAFAFLANPWKLWASDSLEDKRTVMKLAFSERLQYQRGKGFRTPKTSIPFSILGGDGMDKCRMVRPVGFEPTTR